MIDEKRLIKEREERLLVGTNVIKLIEEQPKICEWIPLEEKTPENGEHVLLSFANEKQNPLVGTWKVIAGTVQTRGHKRNTLEK